MSRYDSDLGIQPNKNNKLIYSVIAGGIALLVVIYFLFRGTPAPPAPATVQSELTLPEAPPQITPPTVGKQYETPTLPEPKHDSLQEPFLTEDEISEQPPAQTERLPLPELQDSDDTFRNEFAVLSPGLQPWLGTDQLIRKLVVVANDFSQGLRLFKHMRYFEIEGTFKVARDQHGLYMAPAGFQRYDQLTKAIQSLDILETLALYNRYKPLMLEVYKEFGYPEGRTLDDLLLHTAAEILEAPIIKDRISLYRPSVRYKYSSPKLEKLSPVQKQLIRMGPDNSKIIQDKVRLFVEAFVNQTQ